MKKLSVLFLLFVTIISCKKSDDAASVTPTVQNLIGSYKQTGAVIQVGSLPSVNVWNTTSGFYEACEMDDVITLAANNVFTVTDAGVQCSPSSSGTGTWSVSGSTITIQGSTATVESFTGTTLVLSSNVSYSGQTGKMTATFQKQ